VTVVSATHDAEHGFQRPGCHEGTRLAVFARLMDWLVGNVDPSAIILWMYGDAGAGKSAIGQTFAVKCAEKGLLLATFFFWKDDPQRSSHTSLVATLVNQAITFVPTLRPLVAAAIGQDPSILKKHLKSQIISLLVNPINKLISRPDFDPSSIPTLILIDGLDECSTGFNPILKAFAEALPQCQHRLRILISSRPDVEIMTTFNSSPLIERSTRFSLNDSFGADADIEKFLVYTFNTIKSVHLVKGSIPDSWPDPDVIRILVERSSGQFIFASTVGKYISDPNQQPRKQLDIIMAVRPAPTDANVPWTELYALYRHVLSCVPPQHIEKALDILSFQLIIRPSGILDKLLRSDGSTFVDGRLVREAMHLLLSLEPGDLVLHLGKLFSLVQVSNDDVHKEFPYIRISHASLGDFLLDPQRSDNFYCNEQRILTRMLGVCLDTDGSFRIVIIRIYGSHVFSLFQFHAHSISQMENPYAGSGSLYGFSSA